MLQRLQGLLPLNPTTSAPATAARVQHRSELRHQHELQMHGGESTMTTRIDTGGGAYNGAVLPRLLWGSRSPWR